ncbi:YqkE family protein [Paenisporosarcina quisquiliarum]|uniref:YqkE family protein n=1 Tax=Paenisporosarcina quisquiliarum TaxID=365346 RepID=A0A9X3LDW3_9BACL|nr:YqkE family protein [Paenisporosarcina quisquiliarum]MCZ8535720.1 YqkE family protein [Paenisporosarcina quisquiliarum]
MVKKKQQQQQRRQPERSEQSGNTLADQLQGDVLEKLKSAKKQLQDTERQQEEERLAQAEFNRKQKEKNKSFAELLDEYGMKGNKF